MGPHVCKNCLGNIVKMAECEKDCATDNVVNGIEENGVLSDDGTRKWNNYYTVYCRFIANSCNIKFIESLSKITTMHA